MGETKQIGVKLVFAWIFGVSFILASIGAFSSSSILSGILYIISGAIILPPFNKMLKEKANIEISTWLKILIVLVLLVIAGLSLSSDTPTYNYDQNNIPTNQNNIISITKSTKQIVQITAEELYMEYEENEIRADSKYEDKILEISGTVDSIGEDIIGTKYLSLVGGGYFSNVQCMLKSSELNKAININKGDYVVLRGDNPGYLINVIVRNCEII